MDWIKLILCHQKNSDFVLVALTSSRFCEKTFVVNFRIFLLENLASTFNWLALLWASTTLFLKADILLYSMSNVSHTPPRLLWDYNFPSSATTTENARRIRNRYKKSFSEALRSLWFDLYLIVDNATHLWAITQCWRFVQNKPLCHNEKPTKANMKSAVQELYKPQLELLVLGNWLCSCSKTITMSWQYLMVSYRSFQTRV